MTDEQGLGYGHLLGPTHAVPGFGRLVGQAGAVHGPVARFHRFPSHHAVFVPPQPFE